ncbi:NADH pyrophosphatase [Lachnospiraceae bacterium TWA4]|nr:NADH pyrophosphatase [Lachnospiraceae bacterium TWA4]
MLQEISPNEFHNEFEDRVPKDTDYVVAFNDEKLLMNKDLPVTVSDCKKVGTPVLQYLIRIDDTAFYLLENSDDYLDTNYQWESIRFIRGYEPQWMGYALITCIQLARWYDHRRYCGKCGTPMVKSKIERAMVCPHCKTIEYPKICPAVIVGVTDGDRILVSRYAGREYKKYALLAGFMEIGEDFEMTIRREVMEEVGLKVKNITYYKSQPWAFSDTVLAGFFCQLDGLDQIQLDEDELQEAEFLHREDLPENKDDISLTAQMMEAFRTKTYPMYEKWEE